MTTSDEILEMAEMADSSGVFEHIWVSDQIMTKPHLESITLMASIAARTKKVKIGPACMTSLASRHPVLLAYQWASLDQLSNGRMILAACMDVTAPDNLTRVEHVNMGIGNKEHGPRLVEGINILRKLWTEDSIDFNGRFYKLEGAFVDPKPVQTPPPIWIVGNPKPSQMENPGRPSVSERVIERNMRRVARLGDGWMTINAVWPPEDFAYMRGRIIEYAKEYGRDFTSLPAAMYYNININEDQEAAIEESQKYLEYYYTPQKFERGRVRGWVACGSPEQCVEQLQGFVDAGATDITLRFSSWDQKGQFTRCVEEVLPHLV